MAESLQKIDQGRANPSPGRSRTDEPRVVMLETAELKVATAAMEARQALILVMEAPVEVVMLVATIRCWVVSVVVAQGCMPSQDGLSPTFSQ